MQPRWRSRRSAKTRRMAKDACYRSRPPPHHLLASDTRRPICFVLYPLFSFIARSHSYPLRRFVAWERCAVGNFSHKNAVHQEAAGAINKAGGGKKRGRGLVYTLGDMRW